MHSTDAAGRASDEHIADRDCMRRMARGEVAALHELYRRHGGRVFGFARRMLGEVHDAEEVTQDVFVRVWRRASDYDERRASPWGWLAVITRSACIDRLRRRNSRPTLAGADEVGNFSESAERETSFAIASDLDRLLAMLRPAERACIECIFFNGFTHTEAASRLGLPVGTVKTHLRRALLRLRQTLSSHES